MGAYPRENIVVLEASFNATGGANNHTATANVGVIHIPFKCEVIEAFAWSNANASNSFTVGLSSYDGTTLGSTDVGSVVVPDTPGANVAYYDQAGAGVLLEKHSVVMVDIDEGSAADELAFAKLVVSYLPEVDDNDVDVMIESA